MYSVFYKHMKMGGKIRGRLSLKQAREAGLGHILQVKTICHGSAFYLKQGLEESSADKDMFSLPINFNRGSRRSERIDKQKGE